MLTPGVSRTVLLWTAVLLWLGALPATTAAAEARSRLSLLTPCGGATPTAEERQLRAELELALDRFDLVVVDPGRADFTALPEQEQIEVVREATSNAADTSPVVWLVCDVPEQIAIRLLITDGGVPFVQVLGGSSFAEIALIVRELIGEAPEPAPEPDLPPTAGEVSSPEPPPAEPPPPARSPPVAIGILSAVELGGGLVGQVGASFVGGAGIALDARLAIGFFGRVALLGKFGPRAEEDEFLIIGQQIVPRVELGYLWDLGRFAIGPLVGLSPFVSFIDFSMDLGHHQRSSWWLVRFSCGADARLELTERLAIALDLTVGFMPSKRFFRRTTRETLLETPTMDFAALLGVVVTI